MTDDPPNDPQQPSGESLESLQARFADLQAESLKVYSAMLSVDPEPMKAMQTEAMAVGTTLMQQPEKLVEAQTAFWTGIADIWQRQSDRLTGSEAVAKTDYSDVRDKRFRDPTWSDNPIYEAIKQIYLLASDCVTGLAEGRDDLSLEEQQRIRFLSRQFVDALAPTNTVFGNPDVLAKALESNGESLNLGLRNFAQDLERGGISRTVDGAFKVGESLAVTPGEVVFRNELFELIQYAPTTKQVYERPLVIVPPWINKFYILDLQPQNSFIRFAVSQGLTVFVVSWVNPTAELREYLLADYMRKGVLEALNQARAITGADKASMIGYCIGGTLSVASLAWLGAQDEHPVSAASFFTTLTDFEDAGELKMFTTPTEVAKLEPVIEEHGYLPAESMSEAFNAIRANDLIWSYVINNYLKGEQPRAFDILHWNGDSTRMPGALHLEYLRELYQANKLIEPGAIVWDGVGLDLGNIAVPTFMLSTEQDHIAPWKATYDGYGRWAESTKAPRTFVLAQSGHVAGVVNPSDGDGFKPGKYGHYLGSDDLKLTAGDWLATAELNASSWWTTWSDWLAKHSGEKVTARKPKNSLSPAPGTYVVAP